MKKIIFFLLFFLILYSEISYSQSEFSQPVRLTNGNNDRNPSFNNNPYFVDLGSLIYEFLVFERANGNYSQICVSKIGSEGAIDSVVYLTNDSYSNINPAVSYNLTRFQNELLIKYAFVVWQSNKFGRESVFGCNYNYSNGWTSPYIIDSTNIDNKKPSIHCLDSVNYIIAYESGLDIKYKKYNILSHVFSVERNLTLLDSGICGNPQITAFNNQSNNTEIAISYEKEVSSMQRAIYYRTGLADSIPLAGNERDTIAFTGINHSLGFGKNSLSHTGIFETNRNGNINIYSTVFIPYLLHYQNPMIVNNSYDNLNYVGTDFPITDVSGFTNYIFANNRKSMNGLRIIISGFSGNDTISYNISNDPFYKTKIAINTPVSVPNFPCQRFWFVYNKDSTNSIYPSTIYGVYFTNCFTKIIQNNSSHVNSFSLSQNYPNPFNPKTIINYEIPANVKSQTSNVKLTVYNTLGKEIATLVNENQNAGNYSVEWDASNYSSGIYFYKITVEDFSEVKKMTLLK